LTMEEETLFRKIMGDNPRIKVFEYLVEWKGYDISISDLARGAGISRNTATEIVKELLEQGIIKHTREVGNAQFFILDRENKVSQQIIKLFKTVVELTA